MSNSRRASLQQIIQNWILTVLGLLKSGKLRLRRTTDRGDLIKTFWRMVRKVRPDHEEILLDGTAQSVWCGETLRDRSRRRDNINSQGVANSQNFIMGRATTELELSVESRSFVNQVHDQVRKRQKNFTGRNLFMSMFNDISCGTKDNEKECVANAKVVSKYAKKFGIGQ